MKTKRERLIDKSKTATRRFTTGQVDEFGDRKRILVRNGHRIWEERGGVYNCDSCGGSFMAYELGRGGDICPTRRPVVPPSPRAQVALDRQQFVHLVDLVSAVNTRVERTERSLDRIGRSIDVVSGQLTEANEKEIARAKSRLRALRSEIATLQEGADE